MKKIFAAVAALVAAAGIVAVVAVGGLAPHRSEAGTSWQYSTVHVDGATWAD